MKPAAARAILHQPDREHAIRGDLRSENHPRILAQAAGEEIVESGRRKRDHDKPGCSFRDRDTVNEQLPAVAQRPAYRVEGDSAREPLASKLQAV